MRKSLIAAFDSKFLVGAEGRMPWDIPDDMKLFRRLTMGKPVIMGRLTFESIGKPLPGRANIVLSTRPGLMLPGCTVVRSLAAAFAAAEELGAEECMVIGGAKVYEQAVWEVDRMYLSCIDHVFDMHLKRDQVYFPRTDWWEYRNAHFVERVEHPIGPGSPYRWTYGVVDLDHVEEAEAHVPVERAGSWPLCNAPSSSSSAPPAH